jgi:hypothetical protein
MLDREVLHSIFCGLNIENMAYEHETSRKTIQSTIDRLWKNIGKPEMQLNRTQKIEQLRIIAVDRLVGRS